MSRRILLPLAILLAGALGVALIVWLRPRAEARPEVAQPPLVRIQSVEQGAVQLLVRAYGTVEPRSESELVPQVSGPVVWVSPALVSGGFFEQDDPLLRIEAADYEAELESARAAVARAESAAERARVELARQRQLAERAIASDARFDDARNEARAAEATLREARAQLERAERDLVRTEIRAPYTGRVRDESVDVGQFVSRGSPVATLYAVDRAEVRLPVPDSELRFLDLPLLFGPRGADGSGPEVQLQADFAGERHAWTGHIVRTEGEIDAQSRMVHVVAQVDDPYRRASEEATNGAPLAVGLFVEAEIVGRRIEPATVLPRSAIRPDDRVLVVDAEDRIRIRPVEVVRTEADRVVVGGGLSEGERVVVSPLRAVVDGMRVRVVDPEAGREAEVAAGAAP